MLRVFFVLITFTLPVIAQPKQPPRDSELDVYGDPIPKGAKVRLGTVRWRHDDTIMSLAVSGDEKSLFACTLRSFTEWDRESGKVRQTMNFARGITSLALSADNTTLYGGTLFNTPVAGTINRVDVRTGKRLPDFKVEDRNYNCVAVSPDQLFVAAGTYKSYKANGPNLYVWDLRSGKQLQQLTLEGKQVRRIVFAPDGKSLACCSDEGSVHLFDATTGKELGTFQDEHPEFNRTIAFSPNGKFLVSASRGQFIVWDLKNAESHKMEQKNDSWSVGGVCFSPDNKILAMGGYDTIVLGDPATGQTIRTLSGVRHPIALCFSKDGKTLFSAGYGGIIQWWETETGKLRTPTTGNGGPIIEARFSPDSREFITIGEDETLRRWDLSSGKELAQIPERSFRQARYLADGKAIVTVDVGSSRVDLQACKLEYSIVSPK